VSDVGISNSVRDFIARHIRSIEQLEILLLLAKDPTRGWSVAETFQNIQSNMATVRARLEQFHESEFLVLENNSCYRFAPSNPQTSDAVRELAENYRDRRVRVIEAIYSPKTDVLRNFSDAFKLKTKE